MCGLDNMLPAAINPPLYLHHVYAGCTTHCKHCAGDQTASMTFNPDLAPPLDSLIPDLKAVFQGLDGLDPRADPEVSWNTRWPTCFQMSLALGTQLPWCDMQIWFAPGFSDPDKYQWDSQLFVGGSVFYLCSN
jgi:hypothetical protein